MAISQLFTNDSIMLKKLIFTAVVGYNKLSYIPLYIQTRNIIEHYYNVRNKKKEILSSSLKSNINGQIMSCFYSLFSFSLETFENICFSFFYLIKIRLTSYYNIKYTIDRKAGILDSCLKNKTSYHQSTGHHIPRPRLYWQKVNLFLSLLTLSNLQFQKLSVTLCNIKYIQYIKNST